MSYVLIVDEEADLADLVDFNLRAAGLETGIAHTGKAALALAEQRRPDLMLLDVMLPDISGKEVCRRLRAHAELADVPVIMLTARTDEPDRVEGFLAGADDYVTKPFSVRELVLRCQALLKRRRAHVPRTVLSGGLVTLDLPRQLCLIDGKQVDLSPVELQLLAHLMRNPSLVCSRATLLAEVWGLESGKQSRTVDTHVMRLREKLGRARKQLETVRGVGYRFVV